MENGLQKISGEEGSFSTDTSGLERQRELIREAAEAARLERLRKEEKATTATVEAVVEKPE